MIYSRLIDPIHSKSRLFCDQQHQAKNFYWETSIIRDIYDPINDHNRGDDALKIPVVH